jgi:hypothetical protein
MSDERARQDLRLLPFESSETVVSEEQMRIARRFNAGLHVTAEQSPEGTTERNFTQAALQPSLWDSNFSGCVPGVETPYLLSVAQPVSAAGSGDVSSPDVETGETPRKLAAETDCATTLSSYETPGYHLDVPPGQAFIEFPKGAKDLKRTIRQ